MSILRVIKVGGSLFDLPDLSARLGHVLGELAARPYVIVPGGGPTVNAIRVLDACHHLGEEASHWLALHALTLNAHFLGRLLGTAEIVSDAASALDAWNSGVIPILDPCAFALADEGRENHLPHSWEATSDALAARVAVVMRASELVLLKSVTVPEPLDLAQASRDGHVDIYVSRMLPASVQVRFINLRSQ
jgi:5-(aminomethyl)-3-furanmethanol phosphate kinase